MSENVEETARERLIAMVKEVNSKYPESQKAVDALKLRLEKNPDFFDAVRDDIIGEGLRSFIYQWRHKSNRNISNYVTSVKLNGNGSNGTYRPNPLGNLAAAKSTAKERVHSIMDFNVGGRKLGNICGEELLDLASGYREYARGNTKVAKFLESLAPKVPAKTQVCVALTEKQVRTVYDSIFLD